MLCLRRLLTFPMRRAPALYVEKPSLPNPISEPQKPLEDLVEGLDFLLIGLQPEQGFFTLTLTGPSDLVTTDQVYREVSRLTGFAGVSRTEVDSPTFIIRFATAGDAAMALATNPTIVVRGQTFITRFADSVEAPPEPPRKKAKLEKENQAAAKCIVCFEAVSGSYSTPCLFCEGAYCYDCLRNMVNAALRDPQCFPSQCCGRVLHFDAFAGIISTADYSKYKLKFEEFSTSKPIYCARPDCSTFLPSRIARPDDDQIVCCPQCLTKTCANCRTAIEPDEVQHKCSTFDPTAYILKNFSYKSCPRCSAGIARMYGCSHMRCQCGAHWCWHCRRAIHLCWSRPCLESDDDDDDEEEDEVNENQEDSATLNATATATEIASEAATALPAVVDSDETLPTAQINETTGWEPPTADLDVWNANDWQQGDWDFGAEPVDEKTDTWGCVHDFQPVLSSLMPDFWISPAAVIATDAPHKVEKSAAVRTQHATCLICFQSVEFPCKQHSTPGQNEVDQEEKKALQSRPDSGVSLNQMAEDNDVPGEPLKSKKKERKSKTNEAVHLFQCMHCGVVCCLNCKKKENKRIDRALDQSVPIEAV